MSAYRLRKGDILIIRSSGSISIVGKRLGLARHRARLPRPPAGESPPPGLLRTPRIPRRPRPPARPWQDILDLAYYSGWRKNEILGLTWDELDEAGGVIRLSPARSKTLAGRILPISQPLAEALARGVVA